MCDVDDALSDVLERRKIMSFAKRGDALPLVVYCCGDDVSAGWAQASLRDGK